MTAQATRSLQDGVLHPGTLALSELIIRGRPCAAGFDPGGHSCLRSLRTLWRSQECLCSLPCRTKKQLVPSNDIWVGDGIQPALDSTQFLRPVELISLDTLGDASPRGTSADQQGRGPEAPVGFGCVQSELACPLHNCFFVRENIQPIRTGAEHTRGGVGFRESSDDEPVDVLTRWCGTQVRNLR